MKWKWIRSFALFAVLSGAMRADILNYTFQLNQSGSLDGIAFGNNYGLGRSVTFTMTANSANVVSPAGGPAYEVTGPVTVTVAGVGTDTIVDSVFVTQNTGQIIFGVNDATTGSGFTVLAFNCYVNCGSYDYLTSPLASVGGPHTSGGGIYNTMNGSLVLTNSPNSVNFQITEANVASTPEPSSFILLGSGALGLLTMIRKRPRA